MAVEVFSGTEAIGATEHSFVTDTTGPDVSTAAGDYCLVLDLSDMVAGDDFRIRIYEKARSGDTQRVLHEWNLVGPQPPLWTMDRPVPLIHGWDMTGYAAVGTITVLWSIRAMGGDTSAFASDVAAIKAKTDNLPSDPADASVVAGLIAAVETKVDTIDDLLDTEVGAIKTVVDAVKVKTDSLTFTVAGKADTNITHVNEVEVTGDGQTGTEWGPA